MSRCRSCSAEIPEASRFCLKCGAAISASTNGSPVPVDAAGIETVAIEPVVASRPVSPRLPAASGSSLLHSSTHTQHYRFEPGSLIASRYRIISRLGKGGMGEVFRADDIVLGQPVALKFLPESAKGNANLLTRFYNEVRIARQITHANVCRVYDIGEVDGQPYLSMEYIDGEDLASLLRRIGRLPGDKATEFARKMCAGLAAAHAQGVLHRDLKPANIMIDGRGELRITDFGLAAVAQQLEGAEARNGTPAYMAPEQLTGREVSVQSDLYALGLVFYEMFTGKPPHQAETIGEMVKLREESSITNPSSLVTDIDKSVERAILRCLDADPKLRPASAKALAASLPGGDPLAAALAAGETPSPELVAASGSTEGLSPKIAIPVLAGTAVALVAYCVLSAAIQPVNRLPLENSPDVLEAKAREIIRGLGYTEKPADSFRWFGDDVPYFNWLGGKVKGREAWDKVLGASPTAVYLGYRGSPQPLAAQRYESRGSVQPNDPPVTLSGMTSVQVDLDGRLRYFLAVPPQVVSNAASHAIDWTPLFQAARFDMASFKPAEPEWAQLVTADTRAAWTGQYPGRPEIAIRVEAGAYQGKPVYFEIIWPWTKPYRTSGATAPPSVRNLVNQALGWILLLAAAVLARINWRAGRGDKRGAALLGAFVAGVTLIVRLLGAHHVSSNDENGLLAEALASSLDAGFRFWLFYLALEPWVRRYWPQSLITWSRVLAGRLRDPLVGRDIFCGILMGLLYALIILGFISLSRWIGKGRPEGEFQTGNLLGIRIATRNLLQIFQGGYMGGLQLFLMLFLLRALLKKQWVAGAVFVAFWVVANTWGASDNWYITALLWAVIYGIAVTVMLRFGLLCVSIMMFVVNSSIQSYLTTNFNEWYGLSSALWVGTIVVLALWSFKLSLGGRELLTVKT
jgi:hypothetical protein